MPSGNGLYARPRQPDAYRCVEEILKIRDIPLGTVPRKYSNAARNLHWEMSHIDAGLQNTLKTSREIIGGFVYIVKRPQITGLSDWRAKIVTRPDRAIDIKGRSGSPDREISIITVSAIRNDLPHCLMRQST